MAIDFPQRVLFEDDRALQAADLDEEYRYHLQRRWQHNLALHNWGILCGLEVACSELKPQQPSLEVRPGMALDGFGREIVLTVQRSALSEQLLDPSQSYDVWIRYHVARSEVDNGESDCLAQDNPLARWREEPEIVVLPTSERQSADVTKPKEVRVADQSFAPHQPMKFDAAGPWPVFLGRIERRSDQWTIDASERHYGGLKAQRIDNPYQGGVRSDATDDVSMAELNTSIFNGPQSGHPDMRFAVVLPAIVNEKSAKSTSKPDASAPTEATRTAEANKNDASDRPEPQPYMPLSITQIPKTRDNATHHKITFASKRLVAKQDVSLEDGAKLLFGAAATLDKKSTSSGTLVHRELRRGQENVAFQDVLQFEMPDSDTIDRRISFGTVDVSGNYTPVMEVEKRTVNVYGTLRVQGKIAGVTEDAPINPQEFIAKSLDDLRNLLKEATSNIRKNLIQTAFEVAQVEEAGQAFQEAKDNQKGIAEAVLPVLLKDEVENKAFEAITKSLQQDHKRVPEVLTALVGQMLVKVKPEEVATAIRAYGKRTSIYSLIQQDLIDQSCAEESSRLALAKAILATPESVALIKDILGLEESEKLIKAVLAAITKEQKLSLMRLLFRTDESLVDVAIEDDAWAKRILETGGERLGAVTVGQSVNLDNFVKGLDTEKAKLLIEKLKAKIDAEGGGGG